MGNFATQFQGQISRAASNNRVCGHASTCGHAPTSPTINPLETYCRLTLNYNNIYENVCLIYTHMPTFFVQAGISNTLKYIAY